MTRISVIVPTHNHARYLGEALNSVFEQTMPAVEVIVVDDGSTDETRELLEKYAGRVRVIGQCNRGVAAARNAGAAIASGEVLAFLDADDAWLPRKLERQAARLTAQPEIGLVHCGVHDVDEEGRWLRTHIDGMEGWVTREMLLFRRPVILGGGSAAVVPRAVFDSVGGFDVQLSTSADWDFHYRVARRYRVGFVPEALVAYRVHNSNMHKNVHVMARDMLLAYGKAFSEADPRLEDLRSWAYGRLHSMLAGSFFRAGQYHDCVRHAVASVTARPKQIVYFVEYPLRALRRRRSASRV